MRIGLIDIEPKVFNTAYMQIARYHRDRGDTVEWWSPLTGRQFDKVYCSSIFDFTEKSEVPKRAICGGSGFNITGELPEEIAAAELDYSIYPECDRSIIWFSRGCIRNCPWCIVRQKEGYIRTAKPKNLNPAGKYIVVQDNNFFANPRVGYALYMLNKWKMPVDIQGIDVRTIGGVEPEELARLKHYKQLKIAWDDPADEEKVLEGIAKLTRCIPAYKIMCYVLIGFWHGQEKQDLHRVETLRDLRIDPFVMPYDRGELYQRAFARWVNHKAIFKKVPWQDYYSQVLSSEANGRGWSSE